MAQIQAEIENKTKELTRSIHRDYNTLLLDSNTTKTLSAARDEIQKLLDRRSALRGGFMRPPTRPSTLVPQLPDPMELDTEPDLTPANFPESSLFVTSATPTPSRNPRIFAPTGGFDGRVIKPEAEMHDPFRNSGQH